MTDEADHSARVDAWMEAVTLREATPERMIHAFEEAFGAMWKRANLTLGDVTLGAIVDRVLYTAAERFPFLSDCEADATGLRCHTLRERAGVLPREKVQESLRFVLVEFLTVLGNLTAEILSPALHAELFRSAPAAERLAAEGPEGQVGDDKDVDGEGAKS